MRLIDPAVTLDVDAQADGEAIVARLKAAGIMSASDFLAKLDAAHDAIQAATTLAQLLPPAKQLLRLLWLQVRYGRFRVVE